MADRRLTFRQVKGIMSTLTETEGRVGLDEGL